MEFNWPTGSNLSIKSALYSCLGFLAGYGLYILEKPLFVCILGGIIVWIAAPLARVKLKELRFESYLSRFGKPYNFTINDKLDENSVAGAFPFNGTTVLCFLYIHEDGLVIGKTNYRLIEWDSIFCFNVLKFAGHSVIEICVGNVQSTNRLIVPWNNEFDELLPESVQNLQSLQGSRLG